MYPDCDSCCNGGLDHIEQEQKRLIEKYGFAIHAILDSENYYNTNIHTHGMVQTFGHLDFQIVCPMPTPFACGFLHTLVDMIREGHHFHDNERVANIVKHYDVLLIERTECGRPVLRIVFPDRAGNVDEDKIDCQLAMQFSNEV